LFCRERVWIPPIPQILWVLSVEVVEILLLLTNVSSIRLLHEPKSTNISTGIEELLNRKVKLKRLWENSELLTWLRVEFERGLETKVILEDSS